MEDEPVSNVESWNPTNYTCAKYTTQAGMPYKIYLAIRKKLTFNTHPNAWSTSMICSCTFSPAKEHLQIFKIEKPR